VDDHGNRHDRKPCERVVYVATLEAVVLGALAGFPHLARYGPSVDGRLVSVRFALIVVAGLLAVSLAFYALATQEMFSAAALIGLLILNLAVLVPPIYGMLYVGAESVRLDLFMGVPAILIVIGVVRSVIANLVIVTHLMTNGMKADSRPR
jgi:hypothetical protein